MNNKISSIEFYKCQSEELINKYIKMEISRMEFLSLHHYLFYQSKSIHQEEIAEAFYQGADKESNEHGIMYLDLTDGQKYYNETFEGLYE